MEKDAAEMMESAARILNAVNNVDRPDSREGVRVQIEFLRTLSASTQKAARMEPGVAKGLMSALMEWSWLARTDQDLMNRVGGAQMHQIARRIVTGDLKEEE